MTMELVSAWVRATALGESLAVMTDVASAEARALTMAAGSK